MLGTLIFLAAASYKVEFERAYTNGAWGHIEQGCVIDSRRWVWFTKRDNTPIRARRISAEEFARGLSLAQAINESMPTKRVACDAGDLKWSFRVANETATLKVRGNYQGGPVSDEGKQLSDLINTWCEGEPNYPEFLDRVL